jgi:hypothetical protein
MKVSKNEHELNLKTSGKILETGSKDSEESFSGPIWDFKILKESEKERNFILSWNVLSNSSFSSL